MSSHKLNIVVDGTQTEGGSALDLHIMLGPTVLNYRSIRPYLADLLINELIHAGARVVPYEHLSLKKFRHDLMELDREYSKSLPYLPRRRQPDKPVSEIILNLGQAALCQLSVPNVIIRQLTKDPHAITLGITVDGRPTVTPESINKLPSRTMCEILHALPVYFPLWSELAHAKPVSARLLARQPYPAEHMTTIMAHIHHTLVQR